MTHRISIRVYYEDTDLAGVVYYANYLRFIERGRTEMLRAAGIEQSRLKAERGVVFVVRRIVADYLAPARFDDLVTVETRIAARRGASLDMAQRVLRGETALFAAEVRIACLSETGRPVRLPAEAAAALDALVHDGSPAQHLHN